MIISCEQCGIEFNKTPYEIKRAKDAGRCNFCSRNCASQSKSSVGYGYYLKQCKKENPATDVTTEYLKEIFNNKCAYTNIPIKLRTLTETIINPVNTASIDRIDSKLPYIKGNIQFVSLSVNYAKNRYDEKYIFQLINDIKQYT